MGTGAARQPFEAPSAMERTSWRNASRVWRLRSLCREDATQAVYYEQGVGTTFGEKARGGMFGYGLDREVVEAYEWLMATYEQGDRIFPAWGSKPVIG